MVRDKSIHEDALISVIVPVYNVSKYLRECVDSIIFQSYKNLEIILIDDGSTDGSDSICDEIAEKDRRIKVYHKNNEGLGLTRNYGITKMTGRYVIFVDSDDIISPDYIETLYNMLKENGVDSVKCGFRRINDSYEVISEKKYKNQCYINDDVKNLFLPKLFGSLPNTNDSIEMSVWGGIYSVEIIRKNKILFESERKLLSEDIFFNIHYFENSSGVFVTEYNEYLYRKNQSSLTKTYRSDRFEKGKALFQSLCNIAERYPKTDEIILRATKQFFVNIGMALSQEKTRISGLSKKQAYLNIEKICRDSLVKEVISKYPVKKLRFKQRLFVKMIYQNRIKTIMMLNKIGVL